MTWLPHYYKITLKGRETGSSHRIMYCDVASTLLQEYSEGLWNRVKSQDNALWRGFHIRPFEHMVLIFRRILYDITNLVCYTHLHWFFNPEGQHIFGKQTGYMCTFSISLIWAPKNNNNTVDKNRNIYASLNQYHNTE